MNLFHKLFKKKQKCFTMTEYMIRLEDEEKKIAQRFLDHTLLGSTIEITVCHTSTNAKLRAKTIVVAVEYPEKNQKAISSVVKEWFDHHENP